MQYEIRKLIVIIDSGREWTRICIADDVVYIYILHRVWDYWDKIVSSMS